MQQLTPCSPRCSDWPPHIERLMCSVIEPSLGQRCHHGPEMTMVSPLGGLSHIPHGSSAKPRHARSGLDSATVGARNNILTLTFLVLCPHSLVRDVESYVLLGTLVFPLNTFDFFLDVTVTNTATGVASYYFQEKGTGRSGFYSIITTRMPQTVSRALSQSWQKSMHL